MSLTPSTSTWKSPLGVLIRSWSPMQTFFEGFVQLLQAYVFTLLSALYIGGALSEEH